MRERAALIGASFEVRNGDPGAEVRWSACRGRGVVALRTRIMLADDHAVVRRGLKMVLEAQLDLEVVAEVSDGAEAVKRGLQNDVDLAVIDITMAHDGTARDAGASSPSTEAADPDALDARKRAVPSRGA